MLDKNSFHQNKKKRSDKVSKRIKSLDKPAKKEYSSREYNYDISWPKYSVLRRFLRSNLNKNWNDVYSELKKRFKSDYVFEVALKYVPEKDIYIKDGIAYHSNYSYKISGFYICPSTNLLKHQDIITKREKPNILWKDREKLEVYHQINGVWYIVQLISRSVEKFLEDQNIGLPKQLTSRYLVLSKRQLRKKELAAFNRMHA